MSSIICAVRGCHNNWKKRNLTLSQPCFEHETKRSQCCGPAFTLHQPPRQKKDRREWLKALKLKNPPKLPYVCSYHFVDGKPTAEHPYPEKWLGHAPPLKAQNPLFEKVTPVSVSISVDVDNQEEKKPSVSPKHNYNLKNSPNPLIDHRIRYDQSTQCSAPPELHRQLLRSDRLSLLYTGVPLEAFSFLTDQLTKDYHNSFQMNAGDQVFMSLMKLRLNLLEDDLAERFHVLPSQVSEITSLWYDIMEEKMRRYIPWLPKETIQATMPPSFKHLYPSTTCIIDISETAVEKPDNLESRGESSNPFHDQNTVKYMTATSPGGLIMFVSAAYGGTCNDKFITVDSGFLDYLRRGDAVMANRRLAISDLLRQQKVKMIVPKLTHRWMQPPEEDSANNRHNASVCNHVVTVDHRLKRFRVISQTVPMDLVPKFDKILRICAALSNLCGDVVQEEEE